MIARVMLNIRQRRERAPRTHPHETHPMEVEEEEEKEEEEEEANVIYLEQSHTSKDFE